MKQYPWMLRDVSAAPADAELTPSLPADPAAEQPPAAAPEGEPAPGAMEAFARQALARHLEALRTAHATLMATGGAEPLHDLRVAVRRVRSDLRLFGPVLGREAKRLRRDLGVVADAMGRVRDMDVHLDQLVDRSHPRQRGGLLEVSAALHHQRTTHWHTVTAALGSERWLRLLDEVAALTAAPAAAETAAVAEAGPAVLQACWRRFRRAAKRTQRDGDPASLHRLRLANKLLRDALDVLGDAAPQAVAVVRGEVEALHDTLGRLQDSVVAARHFDAERSKPKAAYSDLALKTLKRLRNRCRAHAAAEARRGLRAGRKLQRRPLKRLLRTPNPDAATPAEA